ncbi:MAG: MMPL family transporter [Acidimicrobiia bacterium]|nr:MMPL family transporter [Acidimicrobiia bacterium]
MSTRQEIPENGQPPGLPSSVRSRHTPAEPAGLLARIGGWSFDHRFAAVGVWLVALATVFVAAGAVGPAFSASSDAPDSESADGFAVLEEHFAELGTGGQSGTIVFRADQGIDDPEVVAAMEELFAVVDAGFPDESGELRHPGATVVSPYSEQGQGQIAREGPLANRLAYAQLNLAADVTDTDSGLIGEAIIEHAPVIDGLEVLPGGQYLAAFEPPETELIGLAFAVIVLILAFGSVLAMGLPIAVALGGVGVGVGSITLLSNVFSVPDFTPLIGMMIGLGVGIDYALFIVTRYREGLHEGRSPRAATVTAMDTAGRAVIFAGVTVVISMLGLLLIGLGWLSGMGIGVSVTVLATMITSVTLLPALLGLASDRLEVTRWRGLIMAGFVAVALFGVGVGFTALAAVALALAGLTLLVSFAVRPLRREVPRRKAKPMAETFAYRWSRTIQRRPWLWLLGATAVLLALAIPVLSMRIGFSDEGNYPEDTYTRQAYDLLAEGFGVGFNGPFMITVVPGPSDELETVRALETVLAETPGVAAITPALPNDPASPDAYLMQVVPTTAPQEAATTDLVTTLRDEVIPVAVEGTELDVKVTGLAAVNIDITEFLAERMLVFFAAVLALSFLLLMMVFRSLLVPIKAVIMNVLSIAGAYGAVVAVFQWGWAGSVLGVEGAPVNPFIPMMLFAIVFGLSMDYEVFLLSRVREEFVRTGDSARSVSDGLASTARVITAAAAIMVVVFGSFMFEDIREIKLFGLGLGLAVLLDATLVRMLLVPATMELLGDRNWWMPGWLDRILPRLDVEGTAPETAGRPTLEPTPEPERELVEV